MSRLFFFFNFFRSHKFCNALHVLLVLVNFVVRDAVDSEIKRLFGVLLRSMATP